MEGGEISGNISRYCVQVNNGATFEMSSGSIKDNSSRYYTSGDYCIWVNNGSTFKWSGGGITGNTAFDYVVYAGDGGNTFEMSCSTIPGNTTDLSNLFISHSSTFRLSGSAKIGTIILYANNATTRSSVTIDGNYSGTVTTLNLSGNNTNANTVATWWTNAQVIVSDSSSIISMFNNALGNFRNSSGSSVMPISATHVINNIGVLMLK